MKVSELQYLLSNHDADSEVQVMYPSSCWNWDGERSVEEETTKWGPVEGTAHKDNVVRIYVNFEDLEKD